MSFGVEDIGCVLVHEVDNVVSEPGHVFCKDEAHMAKRVLFIEDYAFLDLLVEPSCICRVGKLVIGSHNKCSGHVEVF